MLEIVEGRDVIEVQSHMGRGRRVAFLALALVPMLAPYELIVRPDWHDYWSPWFLFVAVISGGALGVSGLLVWAAIAGLDSRMRFDRAAGTLTYSDGAPIVRWRTQQSPIEGIAHLRVETHDWSEGAPSHSLVTHMADGRTFASGSSWSRDEIERIARRVSAFLGVPIRT